MKALSNYHFDAMLTSIWITIKSILTNPTLLLISTSTIGVAHIFLYRTDLSGDLLVGTFIGFLLITFLGLVKHIKLGETNAGIFISKTVVQLVVMLGVILLGYLGAIVLSVSFRIVTSAVEGARSVPNAAFGFSLSGYYIMITYYFIKSCDIVDQILPDLLPKWFSHPFRKFRQTGNYKDLLDILPDGDSEPKIPMDPKI